MLWLKPDLHRLGGRLRTSSGGGAAGLGPEAWRLHRHDDTLTLDLGASTSPGWTRPVGCSRRGTSSVPTLVRLEALARQTQAA